jgi:hypothetical protein
MDVCCRGKNRLNRGRRLLACRAQSLDAIVAVTGLGAKEAKQATSTLPIVFVIVSDPVGFGLVESLARPVGNATGLSLVAIDLSGKRLAFFAHFQHGASDLSRKFGLIDVYGYSFACEGRKRKEQKRLICPTGCIRNLMSSPLSKNIPLFTLLKSALQPAPSRPIRGAYRDCHGRGAGCGGRGSVGRVTGSQGGHKSL